MVSLLYQWTKNGIQNSYQGIFIIFYKYIYISLTYHNIYIYIYKALIIYVDHLIFLLQLERYKRAQDLIIVRIT